MGRGAFDALQHAPSIADARIAARRIALNLKLKDLSAELAVARDCAAQTQASLDNHRGGDGYQLKRLRDHHAQSPRGAEPLWKPSRSKIAATAAST